VNSFAQKRIYLRGYPYPSNALYRLVTMIYIPLHKGKVFFPIEARLAALLTDGSSACMSGRVLTPQEVRSGVTSVSTAPTKRKRRSIIQKR
jgi:hypothetical protein